MSSAPLPRVSREPSKLSQLNGEEWEVLASILLDFENVAPFKDLVLRRWNVDCDHSTSRRQKISSWMQATLLKEQTLGYVTRSVRGYSVTTQGRQVYEEGRRLFNK
jgi:hypothetical protein